MQNIKIAVVDDEEVALSAIIGTLTRVFAHGNVKAQIDGFSPSPKLFDRLMSYEYNIIFLDINMPGIDGIELGKKIKDIKGSLDIIFVSGEEHRVFESLLVHPFGFIRKSNFIGDIGEVIRAYLKEHNEEAEDLLQIQTHCTIENINISKILYIESIKEYQYIHTEIDKEPKKIRLSLASLENQLTSEGFFRIHKGYLVNMKYVCRINNEGVSLKNGEILPLSRKKVIEVKELFMQYNRRSGVKNCM